MPDRLSCARCKTPASRRYSKVHTTTNTSVGRRAPTVRPGFDALRRSARHPIQDVRLGSRLVRAGGRACGLPRRDPWRVPVWFPNGFSMVVLCVQWASHGFPMCSPNGFLSVFLGSVCCLLMYPYCFPMASCYVFYFPMSLI